MYLLEKKTIESFKDTTGPHVGSIYKSDYQMQAKLL